MTTRNGRRRWRPCARERRWPSESIASRLVPTGDLQRTEDQCGSEPARESYLSDNKDLKP
ncbi:hypothetical protein FE275_08100 [Pseudomonas koreensis]|nr:hypothetical protein FE275_08100 [Pseudomonas koreensis]POA24071.1 hypothetical protein C1895_16630 [Pseudomonas sp. FW305-3-2-15-E-TSA4]POA41020.1 hypothetical protein C1894_16750 [Pseudomonas sp. FW305-3-2-15-E-TSA2]